MIKKILFFTFLVLLTDKAANSSNANKHIVPLNEKFSTIASTTSELVAFAKSLIGTHYKFGANHPKTGFDCSGFVHYVFKNFGIAVPRQSAAFKNEGKTVSLDEAVPGDVILFTGTRAGTKAIGHVGIVTSKEGETLHFVHASSGSVRKVIETPLNHRYKSRFVKIVRLL